MRREINVVYGYEKIGKGMWVIVRVVFGFWVLKIEKYIIGRNILLN